MKFGVRECANIVFRAKQPIRIGTATFQTGQPVLYIDTATTSSMEQSTTTVYAQGGRGNTRLLAWEGEKTLTFSFTDALLSPIGFAILSGAGLFKRGDGKNSAKEEALNEDLVHFHMNSGANLDINYTPAATSGGAPASNTAIIDLRDAIAEFGALASISTDDAPLYIMETEDDGSLTGNIFTGTITTASTVKTGIIELSNVKDATGNLVSSDKAVMVDYYVDLPGKHVYEADITPDTFGGNYYVEADTLFRDQYTGKDMPANLTFPNVRLQSNFTMTFAGTGDPSTFDFTMDAFPGYTYFDKKKKVLAVLQVVDTIGLGGSGTGTEANPVMYHDDIHDDQAFVGDSNITTEEQGFGVDLKGRDGESHDQAANAYVLPALRNVGDTLVLKDYLQAINANNEDVIDSIRPVYEYNAASTANINFIELDKVTGQVKNLSDSQKTTIFTATVNTDATHTDTVYLSVTSGTAVG